MKYTTEIIPTEVEVFDQVFCDNCDQELELIKFGPQILENSGTFPHCHETLDIILSGGYGSFYDGTKRFVFCKKCATQLISTFPAFKDFLW